MIRVKNFYSQYLKNKRKIYIFIPPGYFTNVNYYYPVLYMQDGQNIFSRYGTHPMRWNVDVTALELIKQKSIHDIIIVGISNTEWRDDEYTPSIDENEQSGGYADMYLNFLIHEVKHYIDTTFRVAPFRENTAICGSSLGGLLSLYAGIKYPQIFSKIGAISPSLWWDEGIIFKMIESWDIDPSLMKIWIDMGYREVEDDELEEDELHPVEESRILYNMLLEKGFKKGRNLKYFEDHWGTHDEIAWGYRMSNVLKYLFRRRKKTD